MDANSILCVIVGLLVIVFRGPMIFVPGRAIEFYDRMVSTDERLRIVALVVSPLAVALLLLPDDHSPSSFWLVLLGGVLALAVVWLLVAPSTYRALAGSVIDAFRGAEAAVRIIGVVAVAFCVWLIAIGLR